ncbi:hypothetical protein QBC43DRAFT_357900 [Cladorrhinum sp. PSN259]|nr:hypothetical protein QBC43DRAFT_357900 [Cladorrhinum sp. PSN259]
MVRIGSNTSSSLVEGEKISSSTTTIPKQPSAATNVEVQYFTLLAHILLQAHLSFASIQICMANYLPDFKPTAHGIAHSLGHSSVSKQGWFLGSILDALRNAKASFLLNSNNSASAWFTNLICSLAGDVKSQTSQFTTSYKDPWFSSTLSVSDALFNFARAELALTTTQGRKVFDCSVSESILLEYKECLRAIFALDTETRVVTTNQVHCLEVKGKKGTKMAVGTRVVRNKFRVSVVFDASRFGFSSKDLRLAGLIAEVNGGVAEEAVRVLRGVNKVKVEAVPEVDADGFLRMPGKPSSSSSSKTKKGVSNKSGNGNNKSVNPFAALG